MSIADNLEKVLFGVADKWCQGIYHDGDKHCMLGWMYVLGIYGSPTEDFIYDFVRKYEEPGIAKFNDSHTHQEVIWMLEEAVDDARGRGL